VTAVCLVPQPRLVCAEYFASNAVVEATVIRSRVIHAPDDPEGILAYVYTLHVNRVIRGPVGANIQVYEGNDSGRTSFEWVQKKTYLLFLFRGSHPKMWEVDGCGNSGPLSQTTAVLSEIKAIQAYHHDDGVIHGVVSQPGSSIPIAGVRVEAIGSGRRYRATTNEKGEFQMRVPAGQYKVRGIDRSYSFAKDDLSYEDPRKIHIEAGGCIQVQLTAEERDTPAPRQRR
jgi:hypothetical protein